MNTRTVVKTSSELVTWFKSCCETNYNAPNELIDVISFEQRLCNIFGLNTNITINQRDFKNNSYTIYATHNDTDIKITFTINGDNLICTVESLCVWYAFEPLCAAFLNYIHHQAQNVAHNN